MEYERRGSQRVALGTGEAGAGPGRFSLERSTALSTSSPTLGLSGRDVRKLARQAEKTVLVCVMSLRNAHRDLWEKDLLSRRPSGPRARLTRRINLQHPNKPRLTPPWHCAGAVPFKFTRLPGSARWRSKLEKVVH